MLKARCTADGRQPSRRFVSGPAANLTSGLLGGEVAGGRVGDTEHVLAHGDAGAGPRGRGLPPGVVAHLLGQREAGPGLAAPAAGRRAHRPLAPVGQRAPVTRLRLLLLQQRNDNDFRSEKRNHRI